MSKLNSSAEDDDVDVKAWMRPAGTFLQDGREWVSEEGPLGALGSFWGRCGQIRIKPMSGGRPELLYFLGYSQKHAHVNMFLRWGCAVRHFRPPKSMYFLHFFSD